MDMPEPGAAHKLLHALAGDWVGDEKMHPSPWTPQGGTSTGRVKNKVALDGMVVVQHYEQETSGAVNFRGHGIFTFDPKLNQHVLYWFDSMQQSPPNVFKGGFQGQRLVVVSQSEQGQVRATFDLSAPENYRYMMEVSGDGKQWMPMVEGSYRRAK